MQRDFHIFSKTVKFFPSRVDLITNFCNYVYYTFHVEPILYFVILDCFMKVGKTLSYGNGRLDDGKALAELGFEVENFFFIFFFFLPV